jgi:hypothetical protein
MKESSPVDPIRTKAQNYRLWQGGEYGNKLRAWENIAAWRCSGFTGLVAFRVREGRGAGPCVYAIHPAAYLRTLDTFSRAGIAFDRIMVNEMAPRCEILQGEYSNDSLGSREFLFSRVRLCMREALLCNRQIAHGLRSDLLLCAAMTPSSYADWRLLLDRYPNHVLEVSVYEHCLGDIPGRNALVWEVRQY